MSRDFLQEHAPLFVVLLILGTSAFLAPDRSHLPEVLGIAARSLHWSISAGRSVAFGSGPAVYLVLQLLALVAAPRWWRAIAALPLLIMVPIWCGADPNSSSNVWPLILIVYSSLACWPLALFLVVVLYARVAAWRRRRALVSA